MNGVFFVYIAVSLWCLVEFMASSRPKNQLTETDSNWWKVGSDWGQLHSYRNSHHWKT